MFKLRMKIICVFFLSAVKASVMKFDYQIIEGKARFTESIETNLGRNTVQIHTPAHNDVLESYMLQDFSKGKQITCYPSLHQCKLRDINKKTAVEPGLLTESFVHSWNNGIDSISTLESTVITELYYLDGDKIANTVLLSEDLRRFYVRFGYPLYQEKKIPIKAKVLNITNSEEKRTKRSLIQITDNNCRGQNPVRVYGVDLGRSCNYLKICRVVTEKDHRFVFADCNNIHITSPVAYLCVCCPWITQIDLKSDKCECVKMGR